MAAPAGKTHHEEEAEQYPVEEVALVVPETDDSSLPVMTFRAWFLGITTCTVLIFFNTFFTYRTQPLTISAILMQIAVLPIGKFMAATLPAGEFSVLGWRFSLNPGPFNIKEHVIITIFASCGVWPGGGDAYSIGAITVMKAYYKQGVSFLCSLLIVLTTQVVMASEFSSLIPSHRRKTEKNRVLCFSFYSVTSTAKIILGES